ncbi:hypothetical protein UACE39S_05250 [Ureibacillus acetophenoni]
MKKKWRLIRSTLILGLIIIVGYLFINPDKWIPLLNPSLSPTFLETIESNWNVTLPNPDREEKIFSNRGSHGDGNAITELHYETSTDIQEIKALSNSWISGEDFNINEFPNWVQDLMRTESIEKECSLFLFRKGSS